MPPPPSPTRQALCDFLYYAYQPSRARAEERAAWWSRLLADPDVERFTTVPEARDLLARIVAGLVEGLPRVKIGVTSGKDSRGVLGALVSVMAPEDIVAFTRGQPGNPDFDKARGFTRAVLPVHHLVPTQRSRFKADALVEGAARRPGGPRTIAAPTGGLTREIEGFGSLPNLSGYLGDALSGKHLAVAVRGDFEAARARFLQNNRPFVPEALLPEFFPPGYDPGHVLPSRPMLPASLMDPQDQLDFHYRQFQRIRLDAGQYEKDELAAMEPGERERVQRSIVLSRAPYTDPRWQKSWMLAPFEERLDQRLYRRFLVESYPAIFPDLVEALARERAGEGARAAPRGRAAFLPQPVRLWLHGARERLRPAPPPTPAQLAQARAERRAASGRRTHTNWELLYEGNEAFRREYCDPLLASLAARRGLWFDPLRVHELAREETYGYGTVLWGLLSMETAIRAGRLPEPE